MPALLAAIGALVLSALRSSTPVAAAAQPAQGPAVQMATLVNQARSAQGLPLLAISPELTAAAVAHTRDMVARGYMEHRAVDGSTPQQRAVRHGYQVPAGTPWIVVEVISARATAEAAANWLLSDPLHRGVMLKKNWREMGVAYVQGGPYGQFWTIEFGCRPNVLPVTAETSATGTMLRLTNEECAPAGGSAGQMGRATEVMVSERADFAGATWEPFTPTRPVAANGGSVHVKLRDSQGRETSTVAAGLSGAPAPLSATTSGEASPIPVAPSLPAPGAPVGEDAQTPAAVPGGLFDPAPTVLQR